MLTLVWVLENRKMMWAKTTDFFECIRQGPFVYRWIWACVQKNGGILLLSCTISSLHKTTADMQDAVSQVRFPGLTLDSLFILFISLCGLLHRRFSLSWLPPTLHIKLHYANVSMVFISIYLKIHNCGFLKFFEFCLRTPIPRLTYPKILKLCVFWDHTHGQQFKCTINNMKCVKQKAVVYFTIQRGNV